MKRQFSRPRCVDMIAGSRDNSAAADKTAAATIRSTHVITERQRACCLLPADRELSLENNTSIERQA